MHVAPTVADTKNDDDQRADRAVDIPAPRTIVGQKWEAARQTLIHTLPRWVLNSSSNLVGGMQLGAEVLMFKSSNNNLVNPENRGKPLHYLIDPPRNIVKGSFQRSRLGHPWTNIFKPHQFWQELNDLEGAAAYDRLNVSPKLSNRWSARAGFAGMTSMALSTFLPEYSESQEETAAMVDMSHDKPISYVGTRLYQALNPVEVVRNKRPLVGLGMTTAGFFSVLSGFRQVEGRFELGQLQNYRRNPWQMVGGAITMAAGGQLLLGVNNEHGWRSFGTTQLLRFATLPGSIGSRFERNPVTGLREAGASWYFGAQSVLAVKNTIAGLIGGVQVDKDGKVIDHALMRKEAVAIEKEERQHRREVKAQEKAHQREHKPMKPSVKVTQVSPLERALPQADAAMQV